MRRGGFVAGFTSFMQKSFYSFVITTLALLFVSCAKQNSDPVIFLPTVRNPFNESSERLRQLYCSADHISFANGFLTESNVRGVFQCANYDGSLEGLRPLFLSGEFSSLLTNLNSLLGASSTKTIHESLGPWFVEDENGESKLDRLLPMLSSMIQNPAFQDALPVASSIVDAGEDTWKILLPNLANFLYSPRYPDNFEDLFFLWNLDNSSEFSTRTSKSKDYAAAAKKIATLLTTKVGEKTVARIVVELLDDLHKVSLPESTLAEYLDQMNVKNVFLSLYQETDRLRGESINAKLNADPEQDEIDQGLDLTPEGRRERARRKLFSGGENAPIVQLTHLVEEFHSPHSQFLPAIASWYSSNGEKVSNGLFQYVAQAIIRSAIPKISMENFLMEYTSQKDAWKDPSTPIDADTFVLLLREAFQSTDFDHWLMHNLHDVNKEQFGEKNEKLLSASTLKGNILAVYRLAPVADFGRTFFSKGKILTLASAIKRFSNLHRGDNLQLSFHEKTQNLEEHMMDFWLDSAKNSLGEGLVVNFAIQLTQTFFTDYANNFEQNNPNTSLAQWYFSSTYSNPGGAEAIAAYAVKDLNLLDVYEKNKDYLKGKFATEVFSNPDDLRAFRLLVDQIPNIWLYIKSGMSRSGSNVSRALSDKDQGYLIKNYVQLLASLSKQGLVAKAVPVLSAFMELDPLPVDAPEAARDILLERRKLSKGSDALKRLLTSLFEPQEEAKYETALLQQLILPLQSLVSRDRAALTERFLLTGSQQILATPEDKINNFFNRLAEAKISKNPKESRANFSAVADLMKNPAFTTVLRQLDHLFKDDAVRPALNYFAQKVDDGTLNRVLLFLRRILGLRN